MASMAAETGKPVRAGWDWNLYGRWIGANALAEFVGLGGSLITVGLIFMNAGETPALIIGGAVVSILFGTLLEGVLVGWLQWRVLRRAFVGITRRAWIIATAIGAGAAWTLGMLPSTIMSLVMSSAPPSDNGGGFEPEGFVFYGMAAGMGIVLGVVLAFAQWLELKKHVRGAGWWVPANSAAWGLGMAVVFAAMDLAMRPENSLPVTLILVAAGMLVAGAVVGAVHGIVLVKLAGQDRG